MSEQPRVWIVLAEKNFGLFWASLPVSIGKQLSPVAIGWQIYELTSSPLPLGLTGLLRALPVVVFSLTGGLLSFVVVAAVAVKLPAIKKFSTPR